MKRNISTKLWKIDHSESLDYHPAIIEAAELLRAGEVVSFPTETVYGLGANALSDQAVQKIFTAKGRPSDNPLIIHIYSTDQIQQFTQRIPEIAFRLLDAFSPGPLTLILKGNGEISSLATAGLDSVGIRIPDHPVALALLKRSGIPVAAPSANLSGKPSPTNGMHVWEDLAGKIAGVIDAGETGVGVESTVLDITVEPPMILRPGGITKEDLESVIGDVQIDPAVEKMVDDPPKTELLSPRSPGMKYTHYAPSAPLWMANALSMQEQREQIVHSTQDSLEEGKRVGILTTEEGVAYYQEHLDRSAKSTTNTISKSVIIPCGQRTDLSTVAQHLYQVLRRFDEHKVDIIYAEIFPQQGIGAAIMNRLAKAAGGKVIHS